MKILHSNLIGNSKRDLFIIHGFLGMGDNWKTHANKIAENAQEVINTLLKLKPSSAKGTYVKSINLSSTMSPGIIIDKGTVAGL